MWIYFYFFFPTMSIYARKLPITWHAWFEHKIYPIAILYDANKQFYFTKKKRYNIHIKKMYNIHMIKRWANTFSIRTIFVKNEIQVVEKKYIDYVSLVEITCVRYYFIIHNDVYVYTVIQRLSCTEISSHKIHSM